MPIHLGNTIKGSTLTLQGIDNVKGCNGLASCMFRVSNGIADHGLQKATQHVSCFCVDLIADTLDTTASSQATNGWLCDALNVVLEFLVGRKSLAASLALSSAHLVDFFPRVGCTQGEYVRRT